MTPPTHEAAIRQCLKRLVHDYVSIHDEQAVEAILRELVTAIEQPPPKDVPAIFMCPVCDQTPERGHAPDCPGSISAHEGMVELTISKFNEWLRTQQRDLPEDMARLIRENLWRLYDDASKPAAQDGFDTLIQTHADMPPKRGCSVCGKVEGESHSPHCPRKPAALPPAAGTGETKER